MDVKHSIISCLNFKKTLFKNEVFEETRTNEKVNMSRSFSNMPPNIHQHPLGNKSQIICLNNSNSRILSNSQSKPKITVISNMNNPSRLFYNPQSQLLRSSRRSNIFQKPPTMHNLNLRA